MSPHKAHRHRATRTPYMNRLSTGFARSACCHAFCVLPRQPIVRPNTLVHLCAYLLRPRTNNMQSQDALRIQTGPQLAPPTRTALPRTCRAMFHHRASSFARTTLTDTTHVATIVACKLKNARAEPRASSCTHLLLANRPPLSVPAFRAVRNTSVDMHTHT